MFPVVIDNMHAGEKLLQRMHASPFGWTDKDVETLYSSFGFKFKEGGAHRKYFHPAHVELYAVVPRHRKVKPVYVRYALGLIKRLKDLEPKNE